MGAEEQLRGSLALRLERQTTHMREHHGHGQHKAGEDGEYSASEGNQGSHDHAARKPHAHHHLPSKASAGATSDEEGLEEIGSEEHCAEQTQKVQAALVLTNALAARKSLALAKAPSPAVLKRMAANTEELLKSLGIRNIATSQESRL